MGTAVPIASETAQATAAAMLRDRDLTRALHPERPVGGRPLVQALARLIGAQMTARTAADWFAVLSPLGVPCGPVNDLAGAFGLAAELRLDARVTVGEGDDAVDVVANPIGLSASAARYRLRPPRLGEHTAELREWLSRPAHDDVRAEARNG